MYGERVSKHENPAGNVRTGRCTVARAVHLPTLLVTSCNWSITTTTTTKSNMKNVRRFALIGATLVLGAVAAHAQAPTTPDGVVTLLEGGAASTTTSYVGYAALAAGATLVGLAVWALRKGISLRK